MAKKLLMGNEAIAMGALKAGVNVVSGYPGTPSTEVLETIARLNTGDIYVEWSVNEKVAMEVGAGAAYTGARVLVTMKQVGLNVGSDPLMSLAYIGVKGGMVVLVADDPGPVSSQTEQDTRHFARYANLPVFDPSTPEEAYDMIQKAFELSEQLSLPVLFRPTTRVCHSCSTLEIPDNFKDSSYVNKIEGFVKDPRWVIFPSLSYKNHIKLEELQEKISSIFSGLSYNAVTGNEKGNASRGIAASGAAFNYVREVLSELEAEVRLFKVGTPYPFPEQKASEFLAGIKEVLVVEELDPVVEESLLELSLKLGGNVQVLGKKTKHMPYAGEYNYELVKKAIVSFLGLAQETGNGAGNTAEGAAVPGGTLSAASAPSLPQLPVRPPVLCAGCPHRSSFYAVKRALGKQKAVFTGDIGCYTLGNAKPLEMVDTCLCMGAGITIAQGLQRAEPGSKHIAFIGDSTFFHTGIPGIINAVYNNTDITVIILDNSTTAMTGHQPHPGTGSTMMKSVSQKIDISGVLKACGVGLVIRQNPFELGKSVEAVREAVAFKGPSAVIFEAPCIALVKPSKIQRIKEECIACKKCIREIGCPAISFRGDRVEIEPSLCYGCTLCSQVCPTGAIGGVDK